MNTVLFIGILVVSWLFGVFAWSQIIGGFQNLKTRGTTMIITITIWSVLLVASYLLVSNYLKSNMLAWAIGVGIAFVQVISSGKIQ